MTSPLPVLVGAGLIAAVGWSVYVDAQATPQAPPFRVRIRQTDPPVELFVHEPSGTCFVAYQPGGLVVVDNALCDTGHHWPIVPPIVPISPEQ